VILAWIHGIYEGIDSFLGGMRTTAHFFVENLRGKGGGSAVTRQYPEQPAVVVGERQRGHLFNDAPICIVCHACEKACPVDCFKMDGERDENNKFRVSRFDIDMSKCIYCGLCVRACPTDSLSMTSSFEVDPHKDEYGRFLFNRSSDQLDQHLFGPDVDRLRELANRPREQLPPEDRAWLDAHIDRSGPHLIAMFGVGYYPPEEKAKADAEREAKKKAKDAAAAAAKAKAAAAAKEAAPKDGAAPAAKAAAGTDAAANKPAAPPTPPAQAAPAQPSPPNASPASPARPSPAQPPPPPAQSEAAQQ
jgi:formate hydrogenlyase subunit 6/NADH:ubiquinone oxidoreductase subunit I